MAAHSREPTLAKARRLTNRPGDDKGGGGARGASGRKKAAYLRVPHRPPADSDG